jgi:hypothetical protein
MADRLLDYSLKSLAYYLRSNMPADDYGDIPNCWITTPNFDFDRQVDPSNVNNTIDRELPFLAIQLVEDEVRPFSMGNVLYEHNISVDLFVFAENATQMFQLTGDMKQVLRNATNPTTSQIGIPLINIASGIASAYVGCIHLDVDEKYQAFSPGKSFPGGVDTSVEDPGNRKFFTVTRLMMTAFKDKESTLLENLGNCRLDDSMS